MSQTLKHILHQVNRDIRQLLSVIDEDTYSRSLTVFNGSSIGEHMRHIINFYECIDHVLRQEISDEINYADRIRDPRIESDPEYAMNRYNTIFHNITESESQWKESIPVRILKNEKGPPAQSTITRELFYACEHAIHHLAIIIVGIRGSNIELELPEQFGVAPSTVNYKSTGIS